MNARDRDAMDRRQEAREVAEHEAALARDDATERALDEIAELARALRHSRGGRVHRIGGAA